MINNLFNGAKVKKFAKQLLYPNSHTTKNNGFKNKKLTQSHVFNSIKCHHNNNNLNNKHQEYINSYTQRTLFTKDHLAKDKNRQNQTLINTLSPRMEKKNNRISKTSGPQTPTKSLESVFITFKVIHKSQSHIVNLQRGENGLVLANRLNNELGLKLKRDQIDFFALKLTKSINSIIESMAYKDNKSPHSNYNINGFVIDINDFLAKSAKLKITIRLNLITFNYYITNNQEEINGIIDDIIKHINNDKYDKETLQRDLRLSVLESINKIV